MPDDLKNFDEKLTAFRRKEEEQAQAPISVDQAKMDKNMNIGMRAGTMTWTNLNVLLL